MQGPCISKAPHKQMKLLAALPEASNNQSLQALVPCQVLEPLLQRPYLATGSAMVLSVQG